MSKEKFPDVLYVNPSGSSGSLWYGRRNPKEHWASTDPKAVAEYALIRQGVLKTEIKYQPTSEKTK